ncbi:Protein of unknown function [Pyronema omphalodes CBS 100304]|uniref:Uncharacterized protein n=1 Tax=Pyronema omphalodes (strain CBS 100304) TaxID=1076935 RepID=U4L392_PYROM|nr:Protein of unknown function [Pyronema omphalodes CBS 100304]
MSLELPFLKMMLKNLYHWTDRYPCSFNSAV